jgi:hypothetical protein
VTYPALKLLLQAYLTWDWVDDYPDVWAAVDDFASSEPIAERMTDEVTELLSSAKSEEGVRELVVNDLESGYLPEGDGMTMTEWLELIRHRVRRKLGD